ncbi:hypothetical protein R2325_14055 [Mycobacteroides chelonae]|nr:hypothetical protein [Mycobacteroides chelonae]MEC4873150.1 hypothetical protein [Mycobacteroides chelonae]
MGFVSRSAVRPELKKITEASDAVTKWRLLDARRQLVLDANRQRPLLRLMDKRMQYLGTVCTERQGNWERLVDDSGVGTVSLRWSDWLADLCAHKTRVQEDLHLIIDPNPNQRSWRTRLGYRVTSVRAVKHEDGTRTVELEIISLREHAKHILLGATPFSAPEFQPLKSWVWFQNLRSNLAFTTFINLARSFWPILALPTSLFDPAHWLTTRVGNLSPLHWPIQVQFVNPILDQSRMLPLASKWQDLHTISEPLMDDAGVTLVDYIWLPEDKDSPHPELAALVGEQFARPSRACVVLAFEDHSGVTGPTGTAFDGALNLIGATLDDTITEIILPLDRDGDGITDPFFRRLLGVVPEKPSLVWRDCEYSGLITSEHKLQRGTSQTVWTGGHSPTWLNQAITFVIRYALAQLEQVITLPFTAYQQFGTSGLDNVYQGQLDDMFFAYEKATNLNTALWLNDYALLEGFEQGNGYAYVLAAALTIRQGIFKRSPKVSFTMKAMDGEPNCWGYDYNIGHRGLFEIDRIYYAEQIRGVKWAYDENTPMELDLTIGRNRDRDPFASGLKALADGWNAIGSLIGGAAVAM